MLATTESRMDELTLFATSGKFTAIRCASTPSSREWVRSHTERIKGKEKEKEQGESIPMDNR